MSPEWDRRRLLTAAGCSLAAVGDFGFLRALDPVAAEEAKVKPEHVTFRPEIEPLVRLLEDTPRDRIIEAAAAKVREGTQYRELLAAVMLAGVRNIQPRPVGFKFHAVLVVNSAHLAAAASNEKDRWLPLFWALDAFKASQARDVEEGDWTMSRLDDSSLPLPDKAKDAFTSAMDRWDEAAADVAAAQLGRSGKAADVWELFWRYGARDFRDIGHKAIYAANAWRTLQVIGWQHAEPIVRSLAYAMLEKSGTNGNPADQDHPADRPWRQNLERAKKVRDGWQKGKPDRGVTSELLETLRSAGPDDAGAKVLTLLNRGIAPESLWDAVHLGAGELLMRQPGIVGIHCVTTANALRVGSGATKNEETRLMLLLQGASFMTMFRQAMNNLADAKLDRLDPADLFGKGPAAIEEVFAAVSRDRGSAARKTLAYLRGGGSAEELVAAGRRLTFLKGNDSHDYKFSSAALEDYRLVSPEWRDLYLASVMFNLEGSGSPDNPLVARTRVAFRAQSQPA